MKRVLLLGVLFAALAGAHGCAHKAVVSAPYVMDAHLFHGEKIPGTFAVVVDADEASLNRTVSAASYVCSAWSFPLEFAGAFRAGVIRASELVFEDAREAARVPGKAEMAGHGFSGYVLVRLRHFEPSIRFTQSLLSAGALATADIGISFSIRDSDGKTLMSSVAGASRVADGDGGAACGGGVAVLSDAILKAMRDMLEVYMEKILNSSALRTAVEAYDASARK